MPVTLRDVARAAGVSTASASRALARPELVSGVLRARILAAALRLDYVPNPAARALAARRSGLVGLLVDTSAEPLTAAVATAIEQRLGPAGYTLTTAVTDGSAVQTLVRVRELFARGAAAVVSWDLGCAPEAVEWAAARSVPWLAFKDGGDRQAPSSAAIGRHRGTMLACAYLLSLRHRRFATIATPAASVVEAASAALRGTSAVLLAAASGEDVRHVDGIHRAAGRLLDSAEPPTAVVCGSDLQAMALLRECHARGIAIPRDISVVGFGDSELARHTWPALTSVRVSAEEMGRQAAERLLMMLAGGEAPPGVEPAVKLVVRESTGPAPH